MQYCGSALVVVGCSCIPAQDGSSSLAPRKVVPTAQAQVQGTAVDEEVKKTLERVEPGVQDNEREERVAQCQLQGAVGGGKQVGQEEGEQVPHALVENFVAAPIVVQ